MRRWCWGDSAAAPSDILTGQFLDSAVQGLGYQTVTQSGFTDADGAFTYKSGEIIEFKIGEMTLGYAQAQPIITPLDLVGALSSDDSNAVNIAQLLQTLDIDGDPTNGIALPPSANLAAGTNITDEASITASLNSYDPSITTLVPDANAQTHLEGTWQRCPLHRRLPQITPTCWAPAI